MRVFLTGGTGLIGTRIVRDLKERGDQPVVLTRNAEGAKKKFGEGVEIVEGDPTVEGDWMGVIENCEGVINLAGENVFAKRWNDKFKEKVRMSRLNATDNVVKALARNPRTGEGQPKVLVSASAIGYYGASEEEEFTEEGRPGDDYMAQVCVDWEKHALEAESHGIRVALVRVGVVLDKEGGALAKMWTPFKMFVGGKVSNGKQWMSWVHHEDIKGIFLHALDNDVSGPLNGVAPNPVRNKEFTKAFGKALGRPTIFPIPRFMLRLMLGEVADVIATGQKVIPKRTQEVGYTYKFPHIAEALQDVVSK